MAKTLWITLAVIVVLILVGVIYFGYSSNNSSNSGKISNAGSNSNQNSVGASSVEISGFAFSPSTLTIKAGETVTWTNMDSAAHTVTSDSGSELSSQTLTQGNTYSHTFTQPGTYSYHCSFHSSMKGTIVVQ